MTIQTSIGPVGVLHRLALAVECMDPLTGRLVPTSVRVGRELQRAPYIPVPDPAWPCADFGRSGPSRAKLGYEVPLPSRFVVRIDDPSRRLVPRRIRIDSWKAGRLDKTDLQPYVPVDHRLLRMWLWPGSAANMPVGSTVVRGRVVRDVRDGAPARWARVRATGPMGGVAGYAHADDRGEFVLVVTDAGQAPLQRTIPLDLEVTAAKVPGDVDPLDRCADLVEEILAPFPEPPAPAVLDTAQLRGTDLPPGYVANAKAPGHAVVTTGVELTLPDDLVFGLTP